MEDDKRDPVIINNERKSNPIGWIIGLVYCCGCIVAIILCNGRIWPITGAASDD